MDVNEAVTPYQLCNLCQTIATTYTPPKSWAGEDVHNFLSHHNLQWDQSTSLYNFIQSATFQNVFPLVQSERKLFWASRVPTPHHASLTDLRRSAQRDCHLCSLFVGSFDRNEECTSQYGKEHRLWISPGSSPRLLRNFVISDDSQLLHLHYSTSSGLSALPAPLATIRIHIIFKPRQGIWEGLRPVRSSQVSLASTCFKWSSNTGSDAASKLMGAWLQECTEKHESCSQDFGGHRPSRLLDLHFDTDSRYIRLVSTSDHGAQPYATLSYSWGNSPPSVLLTKDTLESFRAQIRMDTLPRTVQHAVHVCRMLHIRFLWVDALCIIQGSTGDFSKEVSHMGSIYARSLFTIAASDSVDCSSGFLKSRLPLQTEDCQILDDDDKTLWFEGLEHDGQFHYLQRRHIDTRAWVYQERLMGPRTLHFCGTDIIWECRKLRSCHRCGTPTLPNIGDYKELFLRILRMTPEDHGEVRFQDLWYRLLYNYNRASLSNEDDRLSALAGVVQLLNRDTNYENSFGLWLPFFWDQLLWCYTEALKGVWRDRRRMLSDVPSWSWIGVQGEIGIPDHWRTDLPYVNSAELLQPPPATPFDRLSSLCKELPLPASTKIRGWTTVRRPVPRFSLREPLVLQSNWILAPVLKPCSDDSAAYEQLSWSIFHDTTAYTEQHGNLSNGPVFVWHYFFPDVLPQQDEPLTCLLIKHANEERRFDEQGLVLECIDARKSLFRRRGVFAVSIGWPEAYAQLFAALAKAQRSQDQHRICQALKDLNAGFEIYEADDTLRMQDLLRNRYSMFGEDATITEVEII
ncbi:heterokaryon incompatibility protein-domain-containing protein [Boeremia exigua]|uniref:heterokaryon incompatibility protein-domain-containing protein n=1 Tax=Boeremia exigua TaxID=749465 RepID=UPI001E8D5626|nr:heterokaryon incompatibility protein-domain-containing protein [Boeremia exigua]KAH6642883.1 heterokaryon incompatibility protein-domain-containing protein [Boeremia exigua]